MQQGFKTLDLAVELFQLLTPLELSHYQKDQLNRASQSIALNLSEGAARFTVNEKRRFYRMAFGSLREVQTLLKLAVRSHLLSHLGMTGAWLIGKKIKRNKHIHLIIEGKDLTLAYDDYRRFGHLYYYSKNQAKEKLATLGVDLLSPDFTLKYLTACLKKYPARMLKVALLDQKYFAGTGNYIANEICARAKILPIRKCKDLKPHEFIKIFKMTKQVIHTALSAGGASFQGGYKNLDGEKGKGSSEFIVFYKKICQSCKITSVKKVYLAQRGTYYCPLCQK